MVGIYNNYTIHLYYKIYIKSRIISQWIGLRENLQDSPMIKTWEKWKIWFPVSIFTKQNPINKGTLVM